MEESKIKITIRQSSGDQFEVEIGPKATVEELKKACAEKQTAIAAEEMRLIFKGKILKDEMTLDEYKITDGLTIHLVKGKSANAGGAGAPSEGASTTSSAGAAGAGAGAGAAGAGAAGANPFGGMGGMGGFGGQPGMGGMGGMGGFGGGMGGNPYGGMGGMGMPNP
jgi:ubiquilin